MAVFGDAWGIFPRIVRYVGGDMVIHSDVIDFPAAPMTLYLGASILGTIVFPSVLVGLMRAAYDRQEIAMRLRAWQLRQLAAADRSVASSDLDAPTDRRRRPLDLTRNHPLRPTRFPW